VSKLINHPWKAFDFLALAIALLGWGGNFLAIRYAVLEIPSWTALSMRLCLVGVLLENYKGQTYFILIELK